MARTYAQLEDVAQQILQDTTPSTYDITETGYWIEESLKELSTYSPHLVDVIFKIESRTGTDTAGTASSLTDTDESQFIAADATNEKRIYNSTDHTWATVLTYTSTSVLALSADIMDSGENYSIYNKRCTNNRQIYIGDVTDYLWIEDVEYPIGTKRNFSMKNEVIEIDVATVGDSDSTLDPLNNVDVLVRFAKPHRLCQLTDLAGEIDNGAGYAKGITTIHIDGMGADEVAEIGDEFHLENKQYTYTVTTGATFASNEGDIVIYPGLEDAVIDNDDITFVKSTLLPQHEEILTQLVAARAVLSDNINYIDAVNKGGTDVYSKYRNWAEIKLAEVQTRMRRLRKPNVYERYPVA